MAAICPEAYLLVDEEYREAAYGEDPVPPSAVTESPRVISVASLSKCHGAPGLRVGWAITRDHALRDQLILGKFSTVVSGSPVGEALALRVFGQRDAILAERRRLLAEGVSRTAAWVEAQQEHVEWVRPDAGAICCLRLRHTAFDDAQVSSFYEHLTEQGVRVAHGDWFGDEARVFRLGFGLLSMPNLDLALRGVATALQLTAGGEE
jgi:DNA-binding transcriptional MocR family regulator